LATKNEHENQITTAAHPCQLVAGDVGQCVSIDPELEVDNHPPHNRKKSETMEPLGQLLSQDIQMHAATGTAKCTSWQCQHSTAHNKNQQ
jgi:hypothetical protein